VADRHRPAVGQSAATGHREAAGLTTEGGAADGEGATRVDRERPAVGQRSTDGGDGDVPLSDRTPPW